MSTSLSPLPSGLADFDSNSSGSAGALAMKGLPATSSGNRLPAKSLTRRQKAAIIVRLLVNGGAQLPLPKWPESIQASLTLTMGDLRMIDRDTLASVIDEFSNELDAIGLSFPGGIEGALGLLDGHISDATAARLRREAGVTAKGDPWERVSGLDAATLKPVVEQESIEVAAILLAKLPTARAAELLGLLPGDKARRITHAISRTGKVSPETVARIGIAIASQFDAKPISAFDEDPIKRVAAVLNYSAATTRDEVMEGLEQEDSAFASEVRKAIFTFADIPARVSIRDVPKVIRGIDQPVLVTALAAAKDKTEATRDFFLENMSKRMAEGLREEIEEAGTIKEKDGEEAMGIIVAEVRRLEAAGEILLTAPDEDDE